MKSSGGRRSYVQRARAEAQEATRRRIVEAGRGLVEEHYVDELTLAGVAERAGVTVQTVIRHFGGWEGLMEAVAADAREELTGRREAAPAGDLPAIAEVMVDDYEHTGDRTLRMLALEERFAAVRPHVADGREWHRAWVANKLASLLPPEGDADRPKRLALLVAALDVYTWKLLRRDAGLSREATAEALTELLRALATRFGKDQE